MSEKTIPLMSGDMPANTWLPGVAGRLERFFYDSAYLPNLDVARAATIGFLSAVCGRPYQTPTGKDLAMFTLLVGLSGIGKDHIHEGIQIILRQINNAGTDYLFQQVSFVSGPAAHKETLVYPGMLNMDSELGKKLKDMANPSYAAMQSLRTFFTTVYGSTYLKGLKYSQEQLAGVARPAFSLLGETTPGTFDKALTAEMAEDGFLSRCFTIFCKNNDRPPARTPDRRAFGLNEEELPIVRALIENALKYNTSSALLSPDPIQVEYLFGSDSEEKMNEFEEKCRQAINAAGDNNFLRAIHNRAALKALILASQFAATDNPEKPRINLGHAVCAIGLVEEDIWNFKVREAAGDIGIDDHSRTRKMVAIMREYMSGAPAPGYKVSTKMCGDNVVPRSYLQIRCSKMAQFTEHKLGATAALDQILRNFADSGWLKEIEKAKAMVEYNFRGKCYMIVDLPIH
jgi:hypothetical protein